MYVCMYVRMYVCMYVCMNVCMYVCMCVCIYVCVYVCMYVCTYVCLFTCEWFDEAVSGLVFSYNDLWIIVARKDVEERSCALVKGTIPAFALDGPAVPHRSSFRKGGVLALIQTGHLPISVRSLRQLRFVGSYSGVWSAFILYRVQKYKYLLPHSSTH